MNKKIYNNLSIDNLRKTKWFKQFNLYEQEEIIWGLEDNLDISIYAKKEYNWKQMSQIRFGLVDNLDVSLYAKPEIKAEQMEQIRFCLKDNLDVSVNIKICLLYTNDADDEGFVV